MCGVSTGDKTNVATGVCESIAEVRKEEVALSEMYFVSIKHCNILNIMNRHIMKMRGGGSNREHRLSMLEFLEAATPAVETHPIDTVEPIRGQSLCEIEQLCYSEPAGSHYSETTVRTSKS